MPETYRLSRWDYFKRLRLDSIHTNPLSDGGKETILKTLERGAQEAKRLQIEVCWIFADENNKGISEFFFGDSIPTHPLPGEVWRFVLRPDGDEFSFSAPPHVHEDLYRNPRQPPVRHRREPDWCDPY